MHPRLLSLKQQAKLHVSSKELTPFDETNIALFLMGIKAANALILAKTEIQPMDWRPHLLLHHEFYQESRLYSLLRRNTRWSLHPWVYAKGAEYTRRLWTRARIHEFALHPFGANIRLYRYTALAHALKADIRFIPFVPSTRQLDTPFLATIYEIELQNGRQIQTHIALLKNMELPGLTTQLKEQIVTEQRNIVSELFVDFLDSWLGKRFL